ncbi:unnamed protein product [Fraxinus pennsylvanica]|uniref:Uncharacterized protein n=1 Tax=Fraxinus pennsylvanica TaxID=56036 RepID=A0AAD2ACJ4_9LAMI|nr:unnamed protein product [Fraxinus pennsylvanica]
MTNFASSPPPLEENPQFASSPPTQGPLEGVGIDLPTIEVRFENLNIEVEANVRGRVLPTFMRREIAVLVIACGADNRNENDEEAGMNESWYSLVCFIFVAELVVIEEEQLVHGVIHLLLSIF